MAMMSGSPITTIAATMTPNRAITRSQPSATSFTNEPTVTPPPRTACANGTLYSVSKHRGHDEEDQPDRYHAVPVLRIDGASKSLSPVGINCRSIDACGQGRSQEPDHRVQQ